MAEASRGAGPVAAALSVAAVVALAARYGRRRSPTERHPAIRDWYRSLDRPGWTPPPALFGLAWPAIEAGLALGAYRLMRRRATPARNAALALGLANQAGLVAFNDLAFGRRRLGPGAVLAGGLALSGAAQAILAARADRTAGLAAAPLPPWLCFATALTIAVHRRNPPSGAGPDRTTPP